MDEPDAESTYVDLYLDDGIEVCGGQLTAYDAFLTRALEMWGGDEPVDLEVAVYAEHDAECEIGFSCAPQGQVRLGGQFSQYHELGHVVHRELDGRSVTSLEEGIAEALGPGRPFVLEASWLAETSLDFLFASSPQDTSSVHGAILTRHLIDTYGIAAFRSYFRAMETPEHPSPEDFRREFERAFGEPLDDVWAEVVSQDRCPYDFWYCEPWDAVDLPYAIDGIACDASDTLGFEALAFAKPNVPYKPMRIVHVELDTPRTIVVAGEDIAAAATFALQWGRCGSCAPMPMPTGVYDDLSSCSPENPCDPIALELALQPGRYAFIFEQYPDEPPLRVTLSRKPAE